MFSFDKTWEIRRISPENRANNHIHIPTGIVIEESSQKSENISDYIKIQPANLNNKSDSPQKLPKIRSQPDLKNTDLSKYTKLLKSILGILENEELGLNLHQTKDNWVRGSKQKKNLRNGIWQKKIIHSLGWIYY